MWESMRNLTKYVTHICGIYAAYTFRILPAYATSCDGES